MDSLNIHISWRFLFPLLTVFFSE
ncbi:hypothetical protein MIMGU_mgv1a0261452mg, partial [Erythranthe guttata]